jgi:hypothetical protein
MFTLCSAHHHPPSYPGLVADPSSAAPGRVYLDLSSREWALLDAFENPVYSLSIIHPSSGQPCFAYTWPAHPPPLATTWTASSMGEDATAAYLAAVVEWRDEWETEQFQLPGGGVSK